MRNFILASCCFFLASFVQAETTNPPSPTGFSKAIFVTELATGGAVKLLGWNDGNLYFAKKDGAIDVCDMTGRVIRTLQATGRKGAAVLERPEAVAVTANTIYVVDSDTHSVAMFSPDGKYQRSFGARGNGPGELRSPRGIAFHEGIVYVADSGNGRIQLFGSNGVYLTTLEIDSALENKAAKEAKLPYRVKEPTDIAVDALGQIYVLDADDALIKIFSPQGVFVTHLAGSKSLALTLATDGIYAADPTTLTIQKYDLNGKLAYTFGSRGEGRALFKSVTGLAAGKDQHLVVGDSKQGVAHIFTTEAGSSIEPLPKKASRTSVQWQDAFPATVGKIVWNGKDMLYGMSPDKKSILRIHDGVAAGEIKVKDLSLASFTVDSSGAIWVLDNKNMRVVKLDEAGNILSSFGGRGNAVGQLDDPTDIAISSTGIIFVADRGNSWVQAFSSQGVFVNVIRSSAAARLENPIAITLDPQDNLYILDRIRSVVLAYSAKGELLGEFGKSGKEDPGNLSKPVALMATHDEVLVLEAEQVKVYAHSGKYIRSFGMEGEDVGMFDEPLSITAKDSTTFFVAERGNKRIQTFTTLHKPPAPQQLTAHAAVHAIELHWAVSPLPYIKQYQIYRSRNRDTGFIPLATSPDNQFTDRDLAAEEKYFYRVAAVTPNGYEGETSADVSSSAEKYTPPAVENPLVESTPWQLKLRWQAIDSPLLKSYLIYQKNGDSFTKIAETTTPEFTQDALAPNTSYTYYIAALSTDGIESSKTAVKANTLVFNKPPLDVEIIKFQDIFSGTYKIYERDGVGKIKLTNNTDKPIEKIKVSFVLLNFMDFPTEGEIEQLLPGQSTEINLLAVFNNSILSMTEDSSVQAMIEASYLENGLPVVLSKNLTVKIYDKHRMVWADDDRFASFVTPKDPPIIDLVRALATQFPEIKDESQLAAVLFNGLGTLGLTYLPDPTNPYQITSEKTDYVDFVQYPRETLERKSGDCDDLVGLYSTALESMGITTRVLGVPGHMLMMFATGIPADADGYTMDGMYVIHDDKLWIPVETTVVGNSFVKAWESGAASYYKWQTKGLVILDVHKAWATYKPATLPSYALKVRDVTAEEIEKKFPGELLSVLKISSQTKTRSYLLAIEKNPADLESHLQMGIILARLGDRQEAMKYFDKVIAAEPKNSAALNNRGNLLMLEEKYPEAQKAYLAASQASPDDPLILVNLAKSYKVAKDTKKAKAAFIQAQKLDPSVKIKYKALSLELLNAL